MKRFLRTTALAGAVSTAVVGALGGTASAAQIQKPAITATTTTNSSSAAADTLASIQAKAQAAISVRLASIAGALNVVNANKWLTSSDRSALLATLNNDSSGLTALRATIAADTTVAQARSDYETIFTTYRVYALALPQVRLTVATDDLVGGVSTRLNDADTRLTALLAGPDSSKDTPAVQAAMSDLANQIAGIGTATSGLSSSLLALTPADYNADKTVLAPYRQRVATARSDAGKARKDIATVVGDLK